MNNKKYFIIVLLMIIFPMNVFAFDFTCDSGTYSNGDKFNCLISGLESNKTYEVVSGDITVPDVLSCSINKQNAGLKGTSSGRSFNFSGTVQDSTVLNVECSVNREISEAMTVQLTIDNFTTKVDGTESKEKLRSSLIKVGKKEVSTTTTTKKRDIENGNSLLKSVTSDAEFTFSKYITEYNIQVLYSVKEVNFTYEKNLSSSKVTLASSNKVTMSNNTVNLQLEDVGKYSFDLIVKSDDGGETVYTFNVERLEKGEGLYDKTKDATLSNLSLSNYSINFDPKVVNYSIKVDSSVDSITVNATPTVDGASVVVKNNTNIKNGTQIIVSVTALDKNTKIDYVITVKKSLDYGLAINSGIIGGGALLILIMIFSLIKVLNKKNKDDPIYKYKMKQKGNVNNNTNNQSN